MTDYFSDLWQQAQGYVTGGGVRVYLKTNLGPEVPLYTGASDGPGLLSALGIETGLIVRDAQGNIVTTYNDPPETDPIKAGLVLAALAGAVFLLMRGAMP